MDELFQRMQARAYANAFAVYNHIELETAEEDRAVLRLTAVADSCNPYGIIHGGALYTLADSACGTAIHSDGRAYVTQRGELSYLSNRRIGDTVRVSLTADPAEEVRAAKDILSAAGLRQTGPNLISCPTCGRTRIDLIPLAQEVERRLKTVQKPITVAVMGCIVNGPGEAREADVGIAGGEDCGVLFVHGEMREKLPYDELLPALLRYVDAL